MSFALSLRLPRWALPMALICAVSCACAASGAIVPIEIGVRARAAAPGEILRLDVTSAAPLISLQAEFLGRPVFFVRSADPKAEREVWSGWAPIGLLDPPGPAVVEVTGRAAGGSLVAGTHAVMIESGSFPEERMQVEPAFVNPPPETQRRIDGERRRLALIYAARTASAPPLAAFVRPVPGPPTSIFGTRRTFNGQARDPHSGLDLRADTGTPVHCAGSGRVALAADLYYSGNTVIVDHGGGLFTIYAHLQALLTEEGQTVEAGGIIGASGATGRVTGPHLHWGAKIGDVPVDPRALLDPTLFSP